LKNYQLSQIKGKDVLPKNIAKSDTSLEIVSNADEIRTNIPVKITSIPASGETNMPIISSLKQPIKVL
jgi:uncharacterized protein YggU (UPF0235/DUF167 family)